jgi:hypothetical protein
MTGFASPAAPNKHYIDADLVTYGKYWRRLPVARLVEKEIMECIALWEWYRPEHLAATR